MTVIEFVNSPWGILCIGILSSILGAIIYSISGRLISKIRKKAKHKKFVNQLIIIGEAFGDGYTTAYAQAKSSFHQLLLVGRYEVKIITTVTKALGIALIGLALLVSFQEVLVARLVIISITCFVEAFFYKRIKKLVESYTMMYDFIFGDEYKKHMMEGIKHHWDSIIKGPTSIDNEKISE